MNNDPYESYDSATFEIAEDANQGKAIWRDPSAFGAGLPLRHRSRKTFKGVNVLLLWAAQQKHGRGGEPLVWSETTNPYDTERCPVVALRPDGDPPIFCAHWVRPRLAETGPATPDKAGLAQILYDLDAATARAPSDKPLSKALRNLGVRMQRPNEKWERSALHKSLRLSLKSEPTENLITEMATAFLLAWAGISKAPKAKTTHVIKQKHVGPLAHVAWGFFEQARSLLLRRELVLFPPSPVINSPGEQPGWSQAYCHSLATGLIGSLVVALFHPKAQLYAFDEETLDRLQRWLDRAPRQARKLLEDHLFLHNHWPDDLIEQTKLLIDVGGPQAGMVDAYLVACGDTTTESVLATVFASTHDAASIWRKVGAGLSQKLRALDDTTPHLDAPAFGLRAETSWRRLHDRHSKAVWVHHTEKLNAYALERLGLPWDDREISRLPSGPLNLPSIGRCLGRSPTSPIREPQMFNDLAQPMPDTDTSRRANRGIRKQIRLRGATGGQPLNPNQLTPFVTPPPPGHFLNLGPDACPLLTEQILGHAPYTTKHIPKSRGMPRRLDIPIPALMAAQRRIGQVLAQYFPGSSAMTAFQPHRSVAWHARMHAGARHAVVLDIKDFFGSVRPHQLQPWLEGREFLPRERLIRVAPFVGWSDQGKEALARLVFHPGDPGRAPFLAQGAPSSPFVANLAAVSMDRWIHDAADAAFGEGRWRYSRYADDLVISTCDDLPGFTAASETILAGAMVREGWKPNRKKTRHWHRSHYPLLICGIRVPGDAGGPLSFPRSTRRRIRAAQHRLTLHKLIDYTDRTMDLGLVSYAYAVTGDPALRAWGSRHVLAVADSLAGPLYAEDFLAGWAEG